MERISKLNYSLYSTLKFYGSTLNNSLSKFEPVIKNHMLHYILNQLYAYIRFLKYTIITIK